MKRLTTLFLSIGMLLPLFGCGESFNLGGQINSVGQPGTLLVVIDTLSWNGPIGEAIREHIATPIRTLPQPEPAFTLQQQDLTDYFFHQIQKQHSVLFVAPFTNQTPVGQFLRARIDSTGLVGIADGGRGVFLRPDLWANEQLVVYVTGQDEAAVVRQIEQYANEIQTGFNLVNRQRLRRDMFERRQQVDIEEELLEQHGFAVNVQHDYVKVQDTTFSTTHGTEGTFVRFRRFAGQDSWRDFFVYYESDPTFARLHPDSVLALRNRLTHTFIRGTSDTVFVHTFDSNPVLRPIVTDTVTLNNRFALETRGTWHLREETGRSAGLGGPFLNYAFYEETSGRFYLIDGMVFAPPYDKREFLRQIEVIAHTFRTAESP